MKRYLLQEFSTEKEDTNDTPTIDILRELDSTTEDSSSESISVSESSSESLTRSRKRKVIQETVKFSSSAKTQKVWKSPQKTTTANRQPAEGGTSTSAKQRSEGRRKEKENSLPLVKAAKNRKQKKKTKKQTKHRRNHPKYQLVERKSKTYVKELKELTN